MTRTKRCRSAFFLEASELYCASTACQAVQEWQGQHVLNSVHSVSTGGIQADGQLDVHRMHKHDQEA
jgi:hypothetical protein